MDLEKVKKKPTTVVWIIYNIVYNNFIRADLEMNSPVAQLRFGQDTKSKTFPLTRCILFQRIVCFAGSLLAYLTLLVPFQMS